MELSRLCELAQQLGCKVKYDEKLSEHCSFRVGGECKAFIEVTSQSSLAELLKVSNDSGLRTFILGKGSNVIFDDKGFNGAVIHIGNEMSLIRQIDDNTIYAEAGVPLTKLCMFALDRSLSGLEFAYGIPGTVGGAVFMNAGAYGGEIKDVILSADAVGKDGITVTVNKDKLDLSYRHSCFMDDDMTVVSALFKLVPADKESIRARMDELMNRRREKQPLEYPSAGSTFKRPEGQFAGKLIQDSGLRGFSIGGAQVSEKHCGFVINKDNASSDDILKLIDHIKSTVYNDSGTLLECEVRFVPYE